MEPFASLATMTRFDVPRVLINREAVGLFRQRGRRAKDMTLIGDLVSQVWELVRLAGWKLELEKLISSMQESNAEDKEVRRDRTIGESPHMSTPNLNTPVSSVDDACDSNYEQKVHQKCAPQQEKEGVESPSVNSDTDNTVEHVRQTFDKLHILRNNSCKVDRDDDR